MVAIVGLAVTAVVIAQANTEDPVARQPVAGLQGVLLYTAHDETSGRSRLWVWNLETGAIQEGPQIETPLELIDASRGGAGWVGLTAENDSGMEASYLTGFGGSDRATPLVSGDLVAWGPLGEHVSTVTVDDERRCELRSLAVTLGTELTNDPFVCEVVGVLARSSARTFLGFTSSAVPRIVSTAGGAPVVEEVDHARLVAVSETGRILAISSTCTAAERRDGLCGGLSLVNPVPATGDPNEERQLVRYGEPDASLQLGKLVGWSRFGDRAYVVGSYRSVLGLYGIPVPGPSIPVEGPIVPERLLPAFTADISVTDTAKSELLVARAGTLILVRGTAPLEYLNLPDGAPPPDGPLLWVPSLDGGPS